MRITILRSTLQWSLFRKKRRDQVYHQQQVCYKLRKEKWHLPRVVLKKKAENHMYQFQRLEETLPLQQMDLENFGWTCQLEKQVILQIWKSRDSNDYHRIEMINVYFIFFKRGI